MCIVCFLWAYWVAQRYTGERASVTPPGECSCELRQCLGASALHSSLPAVATGYGVDRGSTVLRETFLGFLNGNKKSDTAKRERVRLSSLFPFLTLTWRKKKCRSLYWFSKGSIPSMCTNLYPPTLGEDQYSRGLTSHNIYLKDKGKALVDTLSIEATEVQTWLPGGMKGA